MDLKALIQQYFKDNKHMQLATVRDGKPWICTVYFAADDAFNLYWTSSRSRQHSKEIMNDPRVAVTVVRDAERKQALQMTGEAYEVADDDLAHAHELYQGKFGPKDYDLNEIKQHNADGRAYWVFKPTSISFWDEVNFPDAPKQVYNPTT
ncbi:MAG TPA: pyridoxamine 5'-phosphate oxidase family protein [Candidatus Saccharimonadales bacterium]